VCWLNIVSVLVLQGGSKESLLLKGKKYGSHKTITPACGGRNLRSSAVPGIYGDFRFKTMGFQVPFRGSGTGHRENC
jgi:hypothetical protein